MKKVSRYEEKKNREKRAFAALHCVHYQECLDRAAKDNNRLECHKCEKLEFIRDNYQKEVSLENINRSNAEQSVKIEKISCPAGVADADRKSHKKGKKIMEKYKKDEHPTSNAQRPIVNEKNRAEVETQICKEKDCEHGGEPQPIDDFQIHGRSKISGVRIKTCKSCMTKKRLAGQRRRQGKKVRKSENKRAGKPEKPTKAPQKTITICFENYPEIYQDLIDLAETELRTSENQVLFILKRLHEKGLHLEV